MKYKIFISYTLQDGILSIDCLQKIKSIIKNLCSSYIDILDNDSTDKQARVEAELKGSNYLFLIRTIRASKSDWVKKEILIAKENNIPIIEFDYYELVTKKFQPITIAIRNMPAAGATQAHYA